jgi:hypothetical protein
MGGNAMRRFSGVVLLALLLVLGCSTNMASFEIGDPESSRRVLVAGEQTEFKKQVVEGMIEKLGTKSWYIRVIGLDQLAEEDTALYGAIALVAGYRAGRLDQRVSDFLAPNPTDPRIVVFYTRGTEDPMPVRSKPDLRVEAISSASKKDREGLRAEQLAALIEARFR